MSHQADSETPEMSLLYHHVPVQYSSSQVVSLLVNQYHCHDVVVKAPDWLTHTVWFKSDALLDSCKDTLSPVCWILFHCEECCFATFGRCSARFLCSRSSTSFHC